MADSDPNNLIKVIIAGAGPVGKSSILASLAKEPFNPNASPTIGVEFRNHHIRYMDTDYKLQIWDTSGNERFRAITQAYYRNVAGVVLTFSLIKRESWEALPTFIKEIRIYSPEANIIVVGNYCDMYQNKGLDNEVIRQFCEENKTSYFEVSAKTGFNIEQLFESMTAEMHAKRVLGKTLPPAFALYPEGPYVQGKLVPVALGGPMFDFSELLETGMFSDVAFEHVPSRTTIPLLSSIFRLYGLDYETQIRPLQTSPLPIESLRTLFACLYGRSLPTDSKDPKLVLMLADLWLVFKDWNLLPCLDWAASLFSFICNRLSIESQLFVLLNIAEAGDSFRPLLEQLYLALRKDTKSFMEHAHILAPLAANPILYGTIFFHVGGKAEIAGVTPLNQLSSPTEWCRQLLKELSRTIGEEDEETPDGHADSPFPPNIEVSATNYVSQSTVLATSSSEPKADSSTTTSSAQSSAQPESAKVPNSIKVHDWVLYMKWPFMRRLMESGLMESKTRVIELSSSFPPSFLRIFFRFLYAGDIEPTELSLEHCAFITAFGGEYDLVDSSGGAKPGFHRLVSLARRKVTTPLTPTNCLAMYQMSLNSGFEDQQEDTLRYIADHVSELHNFASNRDIIQSLPEYAVRDLLAAVLRMKEYSQISEQLS